MFTINRNNGTPLRRQLRDGLLKQARALSVGAKMPTEEELCKKFSVARMTVSGAINDLVGDGVLKRRRGKGTFVCGDVTAPIYFMLPTTDIFNLHIGSSISVSQLYTSMLKESRRSGLRLETLAVSPTNRRDDIDFELLEFIPHGARIVVFSLWFNNTFEFLLEKECEVVFVSTQDEKDASFNNILSQWHSVTINRQRGMSRLVAHFRSQGAERIALAHNCVHYEHPYLQGYRDAFEELDMVFDPALSICVADDSEMCGNYVSSMLLMRNEHPFDAMICVTGNQAQGVAAALKEHGIDIPGDVKLACAESADKESMEKLGITSMFLPYDIAGVETIGVFFNGAYERGAIVDITPELTIRASSK